MRQFDVRQRTFVGRAHIGVDHLFARRLVDRQRRGSLQVADHLRGAGSLAQQFHKLAVQNINLFSQFFQRHFILVLKTPALAASFSSGMPEQLCPLQRVSQKLKLEAGYYRASAVCGRRRPLINRATAPGAVSGVRALRSTPQLRCRPLRHPRTRPPGQHVPRC